jgi:hypothetical protein
MQGLFFVYKNDDEVGYKRFCVFFVGSFVGGKIQLSATSVVVSFSLLLLSFRFDVLFWCFLHLVFMV